MSTPVTEPKFKIGDLVWAKMKGYSPWPGRVSNPTKSLGKQQKKGTHCIFFFGTHNYAWIEESGLNPYQESKETIIKSTKFTGQLKAAYDDIESYIGKGEVFEDPYEPTESEALFDKLKEESDSSIEPKKTPKIKPRKTHSFAKDMSGSLNESVNRSKRSESGSTRRPYKKARTDSETSGSNRLGSLSPAFNHSTPMRKTTSLLDRPANPSRPETPPLDIETPTATLKEKNIQPSSLKFGFLGLGNMGCGIVKNLLNSGHKVVVWNRTQEKCCPFVKAGAEECLTPADVIAAADITFSCVSDPQAAKEMVFGNCGVLSEISMNKGYVEMTGIDSETSQDIQEAISSRGARYLEAQVQGSKVQAEQGTLIILGAGDKELFDECHSCFHAMAKSSFFLGDVGSAVKMNLVLQLLAGVTLAGLAECMALADRAGLKNSDVLDILEMTTFASPAILEKAKVIISGGFQTQQSLKHMQKDLRLTLQLSDQLEQPVPLTATANEVYKHAKRLGYGDHDVSSVYVRARF